MTTVKNSLRGFNALYMLLAIRTDRLKQVYFGAAMRDFALSTAGIFEPIYLYIIFKDAIALNPLVAVSVYYATFFIAVAMLCHIGARIASIFGFRWAALFSVPFRFIYYILLALLPAYPFLAPAALVSLIAATTLYWPGFHVFVANSATRQNRASSVSTMAIVSSGAAALGPALGGLVIAAFGYTSLFTVTLILLLASSAPFWFVKETQENYRDSLRKSLKNVFEKKSWRLTTVFVSSGMEDQLNGIFWPIFLFLIAISYSSLGAIMSLSLVVTLAVTFTLGWLSNKMGWSKMLYTGSMAHALLWVARIAVKNTASAFAVHSFFGITRAMVGIPFAAIFYEQIASANGRSYGEVIYREQALNIGRALILILAGIYFTFFQSFAVIFLVAAAASFLKMLMPKFE